MGRESRYVFPYFLSFSSFLLFYFFSSFLLFYFFSSFLFSCSLLFSSLSFSSLSLFFFCSCVSFPRLFPSPSFCYSLRSSEDPPIPSPPPPPPPPTNIYTSEEPPASLRKFQEKQTLGGSCGDRHLSIGVITRLSLADEARAFSVGPVLPGPGSPRSTLAPRDSAHPARPEGGRRKQRGSVRASAAGSSAPCRDLGSCRPSARGRLSSSPRQAMSA